MLRDLAWEIDMAQRIMAGCGDILRDFKDPHLGTVADANDKVLAHLHQAKAAVDELSQQTIFVIPASVRCKTGSRTLT